MERVNANERLILALDVPTATDATRLLFTVQDLVEVVKIGLELYTAEGPAIVRWALGQGKRVFLDLKFLDIQETVKRATAIVAEMGVEFLTIHAHRKTLQAAIDGRGKQSGLKLLAVTVLTNTDTNDLREVGSQWSVEDVVVAKAKLASELGCEGVVASGKEPEAIRQAVGQRVWIVTPGVRPLGKSDDDHARVTTPYQAITAGADYLVVGRPIRDAHDPQATAHAILEEMQQAFDARETKGSKPP